MKNKKLKIYRVIVLNICLNISICILLRENIIGLTKYFPECIFYKTTGYLCPACGNTRCVKALLNGDVITAARYNIIPIILFAVGSAFFIELIFACFGKSVKIFPRNYVFLIMILVVIIIYLVLRNIFTDISLCFIT